MLTWTTYLLVVSGIVSIVGVILERAIRPHRFASRWIWACALCASLVLPVFLSMTANQAATTVATSRVALKARSPNRTLTMQPHRATHAPTRFAETGTARLNTLIEGLWLGSSATATAILLAGWWYGYRRRRRWRPVMVEGTEVLLAEHAGPATVGLLHPRIVVPEWLLAGPPETLRLVLAHERSHVEARDPSLWEFGIASPRSHALEPVLMVASASTAPRD